MTAVPASADFYFLGRNFMPDMIEELWFQTRVSLMGGLRSPLTESRPSPWHCSIYLKTIQYTTEHHFCHPSCLPLERFLNESQQTCVETCSLYNVLCILTLIKLNTTGHIYLLTLYIHVLNDSCMMEDVYFLCHSWLQDMMSELWFQHQL